MRIVRAAGLLLLLQVTFFVLLLLGAAVPASSVVPQVRAAVEDGRLAEDYPPDGSGGQLDGFTECLAMSIGLDGEGSLVERALHAPYAAGCEALRSWLAGEPDAATGRYFRYWHGYIALTRPVVALGGLGAARVLSVALLAAGAVLLGRAAARVTGRLSAALLLLPLVVTTNAFLTPFATTQGISTAVAFLGAAAAMETARRGSVLASSTAALIAGSVFAFVDLFTTPPLAWMLVTFSVMAAAWAQTGHLGAVARRGAAAGAAWVLGYAGTWMSKWLLTALTLPPAEVFRDVSAVAQFRLGGQIEAGAGRVLGKATAVNVRYWLVNLGLARVVLAGLVALVAVAMVAALARRRPQALAAGALLGLPALAAPLWFEVMSNHSQIHTFFTYRSLAASAGAAACAALATLRLARAGDVSPGVRPRAPTVG